MQCPTYFAFEFQNQWPEGQNSLKAWFGKSAFNLLWLHGARQSRLLTNIEALWDNTDSVKGNLTVAFTYCFPHLPKAFLLLLLFGWGFLIAEVNFKDVTGQTHVSTLWGHLSLNWRPQLRTTVFGAAPFQN